MSGPELKPCPFCGGDAKLLFGLVAFTDYEVHCETCGFSGPNFGSFGEADAMDDAINQWNTRAPVDYAALPEVQALIAGAYEAAAKRCYDDQGRFDSPDRIRTMTPADTIAARDAMIAEAVAKEREACLQVIADLPTPLNEEIERGHEDAYMAILNRNTKEN